MGIRSAFGLTARGYVKAARVFALVLVISSPFIMIVFAQSQPTLTLTFSNVQASNVSPAPRSTGELSITGTVTVSGPTTWSDNPITFGGWVDFSGPYSDGQPLSSNMSLSSPGRYCLLTWTPAQTTNFNPPKESFTFTEVCSGGFSALLSWTGRVNIYDQSGQLVGSGSFLVRPQGTRPTSSRFNCP